MASGSATQQSFKRALGALKDSTKVSVAKVNSDYKTIDVALVKATNHDEVLPKEKHVRTIFDALSASRPRADVAYCIHALARRLAKTNTWAVALKTLIVIHRSMREVDPSVCEELSNYAVSRGRMLNISHLKDESTPDAWQNSAWVRNYALYLGECLECFRTLKYEIQRDRSRTKKLDTPDLLEQLPALQQLLFRLLACQPEGATRFKFLIQYALSIVADESVNLYVGITDGMLNLVEKFFEMQRHDAVRAVEIYRKAMEQAEKISDFFEICRGLDFGRRQKYVKIEQPPATFMTAMEEYVKDAPQKLMLPWKPNEKDGNTTPKTIVVEARLGDGDEHDVEDEEKTDSSAATKDTNNETVATTPVGDLLCLDELTEEAPVSDDCNALALAIVTPDNSSLATNSQQTSQPASWELELVTSSNAGEVTESKLFEGGALNRSMLDSLYDAAIVNTNLHETYQTGNVAANPFEVNHVQDSVKVPSNPFEDANHVQGPFCPPSNVVPGNDLQIVVSANHIQRPFYASSSVAPGIDMQVVATTNHVEDGFYAPNTIAPGADVQISATTDHVNDPFYAQHTVVPGTDLQIAATAHDKETSMCLQQHQHQHQHQHQEVMVGNDSTNPFVNPVTEQSIASVPSHSQTSHTNLI